MMLGGTNAAGSFEAPQGPTDAISDLAWLRTASDPPLLAASSWDKSVRIWAVNLAQRKVQSVPKAMYNHEAPVLAVAMSKNGCVLSGGCDRAVRMHNLVTNQTSQIGQHEQPVCNVFVSEEKGFIISAGWEKTVKLWDTRSPTPGMTIDVGSKICAMDYKHPALAVARADRQVAIYNMEHPSANPVATLPSNLRMQLRCVSLFNDKGGVAIGTIEGRCGILHIDEAQRGRNFSFKCHRIEDKLSGTRVFPLNSIDFNAHGTFATSGSDGTVSCWDKDCRGRLKGLENLGHSVTKVKFDPQGEMMAYSLSYDWHKGYSYSDPSKTPNKVYFHVTTDEMLKSSKPGANKTSFYGRR